MALTLPLPGVQGSELVLGPGVREKTVLIIPGTSDYVTGGYVISALQCGFLSTYGIMAAWVSGQNSACEGYVAQPTLAIAQVGSGGPGFEGYAQILFWIGQSGVESASAAPLAQLGSGTNLTGCIWQLTVRGQ